MITHQNPFGNLRSCIGRMQLFYFIYKEREEKEGTKSKQSAGVKL